MPFYQQTVHLLAPVYRTTKGGDRSLDQKATREQSGVAWPRLQLRPLTQAELLADGAELGVSRWRIASRRRDPIPTVDANYLVRLPTGEVCSVVGEPSRPTNPVNGKVDHVELLVERTVSL